MPGKGLIILRLTVSAFLIHDPFVLLTRTSSTKQAGVSMIAAAIGVLLLVGLWTPIAGALVALLECWIAFSEPGEFWTSLMAAAIALGLALLGPGAWSVDALTYGRKRISFRER